MVNPAKFELLLANLQRYERTLAELAELSAESFLADPNRIGNAKYHFVIAIECCVDLANHIVSSEGLRMPQSGADSFAVLAEAGIVAQPSLTDLQAMARFRNRLVHMYWEVEDALVYEYLTTKLGTLGSFASALASWAASQAEETEDGSGS